MGQKGEAMTEEVLLMEKEGDICTVTINRPHRRNALNLELLYRLGDTFNALKDDKDIRVVVLRGAGGKAFSSGIDLQNVDEVKVTQEDNPINYAMGSVISYPRPVIAMIYGAATGAGCDLAVACDLRIAADTAVMGINPVRIGRVYPPAGVRRLINVVGLSQAKELFFTGRFIDAHRAKEIGLVDHVVAAEELPSFTYALAREIADSAPLAVSTTKTIFDRLLKHQRLSPEDENEILALIDIVERSEDAREGRLAFIGKRKPRFLGR